MRFFFHILLIVLFYSLLNAQPRPQGDGLTGNYYRGWTKDSLGVLDTTGLDLAFSRIDTNFDIWNGSSSFSWQPVVGWANNYSVHWNGYIFIDSAGQYGFGSISDDGSQILIDGRMIVDNGESQWYDWEDNISEGDTSNTPFPPLFLSKGFHEISIRFAEFGVYDGIEVWWVGPSGIDSSDIPWYGQDFHGAPPTFNANTNWHIISKSFLFTKRNFPPVAGRDSLFMQEDAVINFNPYRNDHDPDSTAFVISGYGDALHGNIDYVSDSTFSYQPFADFFGTDSFYYFINDEYGQTDTGVVFISVANVADKPSAFTLLAPADSFATSNDWNIDFSWHSATDADNDSLSYYLKIFNNNSDTTLSINADTSFTFDGTAFFNEGTTYSWTAWVQDSSFTIHADTLSFYVSLIVSLNETRPAAPLTFKLDQNFPNPYNPTTTINYTVGSAATQHAVSLPVDLSVYNILGKKIATLISAKQQPGNYSVLFDASNLAGGVYFYRLKAGNFIAHKKMILLK